VTFRITNELLTEIAETYGTPTYVYFEEELVECTERFKYIFNKYFRSGLIAYAYKANSNPAICRIILERELGAEVVSKWELTLALRLRVPSDMIVFDGVSKGYDELELAVKSKTFLINVESLSELVRLSRISSKLGITVNVGLRLNVGVRVLTHEKVITASPENKFGIDYTKAIEGARLALSSPNLKLLGLHMHLGSQIRNTKDFIKGIDRLIRVAGNIRLNLNHTVEVIDLGGGYPYPYDESFDKWSFLSRLFGILRQKLEEYADLVGVEEPFIVLEPGRILVASSGILLTRVNYIKESFRTKWILIDAGMNDFMRPALYGAKHKISLVNEDREANEIYNIAGPICESSDVLAYNVKLPKVKEGDLLVIWDVGAYGYSMSNNYNMRPRPAEVLVTRKREIKLIRRRETFEDLIKGTKA